MEKNKKNGAIYLIPTVIAYNTINEVMPAYVRSTAGKINYFLAENIRTARRYLGALGISRPIESLQFEELNKYTDKPAALELLKPVVQGADAGIISEAGCPGIADPGAIAVQCAHEMGIKVIPLVGPSSILLALMASGFNGQSFVFHGYLPIDKVARAKKIRRMEKDACLGQTQIFMETPYRNQKLLSDVLQICQGKTLLCVARDITGKDEFIQTRPVKDWKGKEIQLHKIPAVFLMYGT